MMWGGAPSASGEDKLHELQAARLQADPSAAQQDVIATMQKDFEGRVERYRDEAPIGCCS